MNIVEPVTYNGKNIPNWSYVSIVQLSACPYVHCILLSVARWITPVSSKSFTAALMDTKAATCLNKRCIGWIRFPSTLQNYQQMMCQKMEEIKRNKNWLLIYLVDEI